MRYNVFLVDDDYPVLELLSETIPWERLGLNLAGVYENGEDALAAAEEKMPDILITDIGMPKMDGIELVRRLKGKHPGLRVAILSCHSEFRYAQQAMKLQVQDYLVKDTLEPEDLERLLGQFAKSLEEENRLQLEQRQLRYMADRSLELLKEKWIQGTVERPLLDPDTWLRELAAFGLNVDGCSVLPAVGFLDDYRTAKRRFSSEDTLWFAVANVMGEMLQHSAGKAVLFPHGGKKWTLLYSYRPTIKVNAYEELRKLLEQLQFALKRTLKLSMSFLIGQAGRSPQEIKGQLCRLLGATGQRFYMKAGAIVHHEGFVPSKGDLFAYYDKAGERFRECVMKRDAQEAREAIQQWGAFLARAKYEPEMVKDWTLKLLLDIRLKQQSLYHFLPMLTADSLHKDMDDIGTLDELQGWLLEQLLQAMEMGMHTPVRTQRKEVLEALHYVTTHLDQRIGLEEVAEYLHLNASYFSRLFKKETGKTFIEYVTRTKMERAKELLDQTAHPVSKICELLGYDNQSYFIKLFRSYYGMTPADYRNRGVS